MLRSVVLLFLVSFCATQTVAQNRVQEVLDKYKDSISNYGIVALVAEGDKIESAAIGMANKTDSMTTDRLFCIGSITKTFTATLIFKLQEEGKLNINDSIGKYLELDNPFIDTAITIKQLLNHSSGVKDFGTVELLNEVVSNPKKIYTTDFCLAKIDTIGFKKGEKHSYSNSNYLLLAMIIEQASQLPLEEAYRKYLFEPYGLQNTYPYLSEAIDNMAHPMWREHDMFELVPFKPVNDISIGDGNIVTSAAELARFYNLLVKERKILSPESYKQMLDFQHNDKNLKRGYGCGIFEKHIAWKHMVYHTGRQLSYIATCIHITSENRTIVVLTNNMDDTYADMVVNDLVGAKFY